MKQIYSVYNVYQYKIAKSCGDPSSLLVARKQTYPTGGANPSEPTEGASWTVVCQIGFEWSDGTLSYLLTCNATVWSVLKVACEGTSRHPLKRTSVRSEKKPVTNLTLCLSTILVIDCGDPTTNLSSAEIALANSSPPSATVYLTVLSIVCERGFAFANGNKTNIITCNSVKLWLWPSTSCIRMSSFSSNFL